jgi:hypothetical protein
MFMRHCLRKTITKMAGGVVEGVGPEFKPQYAKKKWSPHSVQWEDPGNILFTRAAWNAC